MAVVETREKLMWAKTTILKIWRSHRQELNDGGNGTVSHEEFGPEAAGENSGIGDIWLSL